MANKQYEMFRDTVIELVELKDKELAATIKEMANDIDKLDGGEETKPGITKEEILSIKDGVKRQKMIRENIQLFA